MSSAAMCRNGADFGRCVELIMPIEDPTDPASSDLVSTMTVGAPTGSSPLVQRSSAGRDCGRRAS